MTSGISPTSASNTDQSAPGAAAPASSSSALGSKDVFLRLLVSQIKNQDPLNPMDSMNFVTQLAQFSQLEAILGMRSDLQAVAQNLPTTDPSTAS